MTTSQSWLTSLRNSYSRRNKITDQEGPNPGKRFRFRVLKLCKDKFYRRTDMYGPFFGRIHDRLEYICGGSIVVNPMVEYRNSMECVNDFLTKCLDHLFFEFIELIFQVQVELRVPYQFRVTVDEINGFLDLDDMPYRLTEAVYRSQTLSSELANGVPLPLPVTEEPTHYPMIVRRDSEVLDQEAIEPTLTLLKQVGFEPANKEFLDALQDFKEGDYQDCVRKCGDAFESVMKIICGKNNWNYPDKAEGIKLLNIIIPKTNLDSHFKKLMQLVTIIRNNCAHGAGETLRVVPKHEAQFMINSTASAILLLVEETSTANGRN